MRLFAISDLHLHYPENRTALLSLRAHPDDYLALIGDLGETEEHLRFAFDILGPRFEKLIWVPGNHELWTAPSKQPQIEGEAKYNAYIELAREYDVLTPEDKYPLVNFGGKQLYVCPLCILYDYTFCPERLSPEMAIEWAQEAGVRCMDEARLRPTPYSSVAEWCQVRCDMTEKRLAALNGAATILINHFPLRYDLVFLPLMPRFSIWCGTVRTTDWHTRFNAELVLSGHLHMPSTQYRNGVRFEEVSFGYPREWTGVSNANQRMRQVMPAADPTSGMKFGWVGGD